MSDLRYFQTTKKGEIHELKEELHSSHKEKKKEAIKKIIAAMTVGKDVSTLFSDVVNCMQTSNIELKKLVYLYVINYAKVQPELAILAVNTFRKDSSDPNPLIRALAIRTMGCIRLEQITEYLIEPLRRCLKDEDPYVRKTAVICIAKLYDISPKLVEEEGFIETLLNILDDNNAMVVANAIISLTDICENSNKSILKDVINKDENNVNKLLNAINECVEWGQVFILDALVLYEPKNSKDAERVLERILPRLSHANSAVVLSSIKVILSLLDKINDKEFIKNVHKKLSPSLVTLLSAEPEIQYIALRNINLITQKLPHMLVDKINMFFCKYNEPAYVKMEKLDIIIRLVSDKNVDLVLYELKEYSTEVDVEFVKKSVRAIGSCAIKLPQSSEKCINILLDLIDTKINYVIQECIVVIKDIFRKYPNKYESIITILCENLESLDESNAKASLIWIIGEYVERIENADELIDSFLENFLDEPYNVQLQILTASVKLFLKCSKNTKDIITKVLKLATEESDNPDLRDRAFIYWRLLSKNVEIAKKIVLAEKPPIQEDNKITDTKVLNKLIKNISMLSSVYHKLPETFISKKASYALHNDKDDDDDDDRIDNMDEYNVSKFKKQMERQKYESYSSESRKSKGSRSSSESSNNSSDDANDDKDDDDDADDSKKSMDLIGLNDDESSNAKPRRSAPPVKLVQVLSPEDTGLKGQTGLSILSSINRVEGKIQLKIAVTNQTPNPLVISGVQINKNSFGLSSPNNLDVQNISFGETKEMLILLVPNMLNSNTPPSTPLFLQVAIKTSIDIFYFNVPYDIFIVFVENFNMEKEIFKKKWQLIEDSKESILMASSPMVITSDILIKRMKIFNISLIARRNVNNMELYYFACITTNNLVILSEVAIQPEKKVVKLCVRTDSTSVIPLYKLLFVKAFSLSVTQT
ncbi:AP-1 complex subunit beta, putative [Plasmodium knowlesi strain H]|uniref:AP complex subunit beta n=3 Tax=Plasmodium knowlesi TaxID=5850 RepID=A0A5K1V699_PLAKH|nr:AP-1 complex subunit beta, putative [Plasmodium knowlesi strain H]OTN67197.1 AP complex subunit beta [Plasmodium knowlesi]CAA9988554.1 AP-1 complex subunit beta, putative [Plasmodium knowlesi strain H]SBO21346.1 AP-1 complex subunit beta, putative [Plasmodium knowlesi strain H]SBO21799.1 AP-1 complex subunit beta, putative [Plasmodium knowlesi strain H]VVS78028.1 AP-1 complex subunit beta, putative [Plasmodium knowlesi strain H]|eukprot:XP_002259530.1 beta adaptin protein, putative [Plasmodium knowlesi strain H]